MRADSYSLRNLVLIYIILVVFYASDVYKMFAIKIIYLLIAFQIEVSCSVDRLTMDFKFK